MKFLAIWKLIDYFRHILKSSASMYGSSEPLFLRTTIGTQQGPDVFHESSLVKRGSHGNIIQLQLCSER